MAVSRGALVALIAGLTLPPFAWAGLELGLGSTLRLECVAAGSPLGPIWGGFCLALCAVAAWLARRGASISRAGAALGQLGAGLFALAIVFQTLATAIIPPCAR